MEVLKERTVEGVKYSLVREKTDAMGKQYEYQVQAGRGQAGRTKTFNPTNNYYRRDEAEQVFTQIVSGKQKSAGRNRARERKRSKSRGLNLGLGDGIGGGMSGGGGPMLPDFGGSSDDGDAGGPFIPGLMNTDEDDEDDDTGFNFPGF